MSIKVEYLTSEHVKAIIPRLMERHAHVARAMQANPDYARMLTSAGPCAAFLHNGIVMAIAGIVDLAPGRCFVHCAFSYDCRQAFIPLLRTMRAMLHNFPRHRYEAYVPVDFLAGYRLVRWAKFEYEGLMRGFADDGSDRELWALVKDGVQ